MPGPDTGRCADICGTSRSTASTHYVDGLAHTNTIEGFWSLLKRAWYGTHHHYTDEHSIAYVVESCYKYNARNSENVFEGFLQEAVA